jgi:hypothetical protein
VRSIQSGVACMELVLALTAVAVVFLGCGDAGDSRDYEHLFGESASDDDDGDDDDGDDDESPFDEWRSDLPQQDLSFSYSEVVMVPSEVDNARWFAPTSEGACVADGDRYFYCVDSMGNVLDIYGWTDVGGAASADGEEYVLESSWVYGLVTDELVYSGELAGLGGGEGSLWGVDPDLRLLRISPNTGDVLDNVALPGGLDNWFDVDTARIGIAVKGDDLWLSFWSNEREGRWLSLLSADMEIQGVWKLVMSGSGDDLSFYGLAYRNGDLWFGIGDSVAIRRLTWE